MKKIESNWVKLIISGTTLIVIYKLLNNFDDVKILIDKVTDILFPCILGTIIAFFLQIPAQKLEDCLEKVNIAPIRQNARIIGTLLLYLLILVGFGFTIMYFVPGLYRNIQELITNLPGYFKIIERHIADNEYLAKVDFIGFLQTKFYDFFSPEKFEKYIGIISGIANSFISVVVSIVISIYIIVDRDTIMNYIRKIKRGIFGSGFETVAIYGKKIIGLFYSYFGGLALDALIVGVVTVIGLSLLKVPYAVLLGLLTGIGNLIPVFGLIISTVILCAISLIAGGPVKMVSVLIFLIILYIADGYIIQPKVISKTVGVRPLLIMVAVIVFGDLFGFVGMIIGVPLIAAIKMILDDYLEDGKLDGGVEVK